MHGERERFMDRERMDEFVASAALLAAHLTRQCEQAATAQRASAEALQEAATGLATRVDSDHETLLRMAGRAIRDVLDDGLDAATARADTATQRLERVSAALERAQEGLGARTRMLGGGALLALGLTAAAILGVTAHIAQRNLDRAERAAVRAEVLEALQQVAITACDGAPCIKLEDGLRRWPANDEYVLVDTGQVAP